MDAAFWLAVGSASSSAALSAGVLAAALTRPRRATDRHRPPPPAWLRPVWPLARRCGEAIDVRLPGSYVRRVARRLRAADIERAVQPGEWCAARLAYGAAGAAGIAVLALLAGLPAVGAGVLGGIAGVAMPELRLREAIARREASIRRELPVYLDVLTLAVESGSSLTAAIALATEKAPDGPLRRAFARFLADGRAGRPRSDALRALDEHAAAPAVTALVAALLHSEQTGARLGPVLRAQATQRTQERFARAEKLAMQAPVRLLAPLILCIFPCTFLVLGFPIVVKLMAGF
jgi:tight adherence protein C